MTRSVTDDQIDQVIGAFFHPDRDIFRTLLEWSYGMGGDLAELGVSFGASAVLIGSHLGEGETFTVVDLFGSDAADSANAEEVADSYPGLTRAAFETNYLEIVGPPLPHIITGYSTTIIDHAPHGTHRFVHVDASHLYEHVAADIQAARTLLKPDGILVLDDFRQPHTPGVAAAAWQAVTALGLRPFAISPNKMYATWGDASGPRLAVEAWLATTTWRYETQQVNDMPLLRVLPREVVPLPEHPARKFVPPVLWTYLRRRLGRDA